MNEEKNENPLGPLHQASLDRVHNAPESGLDSRGIPFPASYPNMGDDPPPVQTEKE